MSNPSSPANSTAGEQQDFQDQLPPDEHLAGIIVPGDEEEEEDDKLSPARCEWEFRLAATVPSPAMAGASDSIGSVDFDHSGRHLATGGIARKIRIYSLSDPSSPSSCICVPAKLSSVRWRPDSSPAAAHVGCGDYDGVVTEYDVERGVPVWERDEHDGRRVWALDYSAAGGMVASGSDDRTAHARRADVAREVRSYSGHVSGRSFVGMGVWRGAGLVASGSESGHVFVYDLRWSKPIWVHPFAAVGAGDGDGDAAFASAVAWRQNGDGDGEGKLVAGGSDGVLKLFTCHRRLDGGDDVERLLY
uniref:Uncharacterized protein n=1 Tax=Leersia perrieri TaxID=77586 RepID=A0A0D9VBB1_9ORYZ